MIKQCDHKAVIIRIGDDYKMNGLQAISSSVRTRIEKAKNLLLFQVPYIYTIYGNHYRVCIVDEYQLDTSEVTVSEFSIGIELLKRVLYSILTNREINKRKKVGSRAPNTLPGLLVTRRPRSVNYYFSQVPVLEVPAGNFSISRPPPGGCPPLLESRILRIVHRWSQVRTGLLVLVSRSIGPL